MYSFNIFTKAGIAPRANALVYGIKTGLLPTSSVQDFEEYMMTNCSIEGSYDLLIFEGSTEDALKALYRKLRLLILTFKKSGLLFRTFFV